MAIIDQKLTEQYAIYNGDGLELLPTLPVQSIDLSVHSPPFATDSGGCLYHYSSSDRDLSNCRSYAEFFEHYGFFVSELERLTKPGRMACVHCMDVPSGNSGCDSYADFPGDIIRLYEQHGFRQASPRITIWKEPLTVRNRTLTKALAHKSVVDDSCDCCVAGADYLLIFRRKGENAIPVTHERGLLRYFGERKVPHELRRYRAWKGSQIENRFSHWIWRQYASCVWDDIRGNTGTKAKGVLSFKDAREDDDESHLHPLQLDVISRAVELWSNPGEKILTPFMGVGSEVYAAVRSGRKGIGVELKPSYYRQAIENLATVQLDTEDSEQASLFEGMPEPEEIEA